MAFFKFRWPSQKQQDGKAGKSARPSSAESIDAMRRRARHRLMGAAVLIVLGVVGFPMLFDTQPRPIPVNTPIEIPDRNKVAPLVVPADAPHATGPAVAAPRGRTSAATSLGEGEEMLDERSPANKAPAAAPVPAFQPRSDPKAVVKVETPPEPKSEPKPQAKPETKADSKPVTAEHAPKPEPAKAAKPAVPSDDAARARALLEGRAPPPVAVASSQAARSATPEGRFIVQVGAFADAGAAQEVRQKLERAGLKTYTQVVNTKDGKRTRVRVGPLEGRGEADKAAARIKGLGLPASVQPQ